LLRQLAAAKRFGEAGSPPSASQTANHQPTRQPSTLEVRVTRRRRSASFRFWTL